MLRWILKRFISEEDHKRLCRALRASLNMQALEAGTVPASQLAASIRFSYLYSHSDADELRRLSSDDFILGRVNKEK